MLKAAVAAAGLTLKNPGHLDRTMHRIAGRDATRNPIEKEVQSLVAKSEARTEDEVNVEPD